MWTHIHTSTQMLHTHINTVIFRCTLRKTAGPVMWRCTNFHSELAYCFTVTHFFRNSSSAVLWAPQPCLHFLVGFFFLSPGLRLEFFRIKRQNPPPLLTNVGCFWKLAYDVTSKAVLLEPGPPWAWPKASRQDSPEVQDLGRTHLTCTWGQASLRLQGYQS